MTGGDWQWRPSRAEGIWRHGAPWVKPLVAAAPWVTLGLLLVMFLLLGGKLTGVPGTVFELPEPSGRQLAAPGLAALVMPSVREGRGAEETLVFFDDARYSLADDASVAALREQLDRRVREDPVGMLLLLVDRRVGAGEVMALSRLAREVGVKRIEIAEKRE